jgi:hypothetical protein
MRRVALQHPGERVGHLDGGGEALGIHLVGVGCPEQVDALECSQLRVAVLVARIGVEVLAGPELGRVDEEAHHDDVAVVTRLPHQGQMALVEVAHGGDQPDPLALAARLGESLAQLRLAADDLHARTLR